MAGTEGMEGTGKISQEGVSKIVDSYRAEGMTDSAQAKLKDQLGTRLQPLFELDDGEVKMLNALPPETVDTLFHLCTRAASSGGKIDYKRSETGGPKMEIGYTEHIDHKPAGGGPPKSVCHVKIICFKYQPGS
jgi:hypothetical protein